MNWAPPKDLAALKAAPTLGISNSAEAKTESPWLTLAKLSGSLGGAFGAGIKADAQVSVDKGKFILNMKAAVVLGPGATGSFAFEVGYEAVVDLINLFRRELHENEGQRVTWMSEEAADLASRLNLLGAAGLDVDMIYLMGVDVIMSLYETLTSWGQGGPIAGIIVEYDKQNELQQWFIEASPAALGPMLMTLVYQPKAFEIKISGRDGLAAESRSYTEAQAHLLQQKAIERIITWIYSNAQRNNTISEAQSQFEESCMRMNRFGAKVEKSGQAYCESRQALNYFMGVAVLKHENPEGDGVRSEYFSNSKALCERLDGHCKTYTRYSPFAPTDMVLYKGPTI